MTTIGHYNMSLQYITKLVAKLFTTVMYTHLLSTGDFLLNSADRDLVLDLVLRFGDLLRRGDLLRVLDRDLLLGL